MKGERWFWIVGIVLSGLGIYGGLYGFFNDTWSPRTGLAYRPSRATAAGFTTIMVFMFGISVRALVLTFREPSNHGRPE